MIEGTGFAARRGSRDGMRRLAVIKRKVARRGGETKVPSRHEAQRPVKAQTLRSPKSPDAPSLYYRLATALPNDRMGFASTQLPRCTPL
jgi:hypothetical protein